MHQSHGRSAHMGTDTGRCASSAGRASQHSSGARWEHVQSNAKSAINPHSPARFQVRSGRNCLSVAAAAASALPVSRAAPPQPLADSQLPEGRDSSCSGSLSNSTSSQWEQHPKTTALFSSSWFNITQSGVPFSSACHY